MNKLQVFNNNEFGDIRTLVINNEPYFMLNDVCSILELKNVSQVKSRLLSKGVITNDVLTKGGKQQATFISESNFYKVVFQSRKPQAEQFTDWVTSEVLPTIRRKGAYITSKADPQNLKDKANELIKQQEIQARLNNSRARQASVLLRIAKDTEIKEYKQILHSHASKIVVGQDILPLPQAERKTFSAKEIGEKLGISANMVGRLTNANNLKIDEYGKLFYDKSKHSSKQVETFRYYDNIIPVLENISKGAC